MSFEDFFKRHWKWVLGFASVSIIYFFFFVLFVVVLEYSRFGAQILSFILALAITLSFYFESKKKVKA